MAARQIVCPKCGRADTVRKVSAIVADGTVLTDTSAVGLATNGELVGLLGASSSRSALVEKLSPPRKPVKPFGYGFVGLSLLARLVLTLVAFLTVVGLAAISFLVLVQNYRANPLLILIPIAAVLVFAACLLNWIARSLWREIRSAREARTDYTLRYQEWERASERWKQLYYCLRDDGVFFPAQAVLVSAVQMKPYLFSGFDRK